MIAAAKRLLLTYAPKRLLRLAKKVHYLAAVRAFSEHDERELLVVRRLVRRGDHVADIGANVGWYTRVLSELVGGKGRVFSIEPIPETFELLSFCVRRLRLTNVTLFNCAGSDREGKSLMRVPQYDTGGENFYQATLVSADAPRERSQRYEVTCRSLDSLLGGVSGGISFVKCDVEGHELAVIRGAGKLIADFKPALLVEVSGNPDDGSSDAAALFELLEKQEYRAWLLDRGRIRRRRAGDTSVNYFFLTQSHVEQVKELVS
jgi:FkbM family methyltransferase